MFFVMVCIAVLYWSSALVGPAQGPSRWCRNRRASVVAGLFLLAGLALIVALMIDCRYSCQQWQSTLLDILATFAAFLMGLILTRALDRDAEPSVNVKNTAILFTILLVVSTFMLTVFSSASHSKAAVLLIWALGLPVLGWLGKRLWPWLF